MNITDVLKAAKKHKARKRVGRGAASGAGKTAGRGQKGLGSRAGANYLKGFIGGQTTLMTRLPKRGFNNANFRVAYVPVNLSFLEERFEAGATVDRASLKKAGLTLKRDELVKVLGGGELTKALTVKVHGASKSARAAIEKAGGSVEILPGPKRAKTAEATE